MLLSSNPFLYISLKITAHSGREFISSSSGPNTRLHFPDSPIVIRHHWTEFQPVKCK